MSSTTFEIGDLGARRVKYAAIIVWAAGIAVATLLGSQVLQFKEFSPEDVGRVLTRMVLLSLFLERALEVILTAWRRQELDDLCVQQDRAKQSGEQTVWLDQKIARYRARTREMAFLIGLAIGTALSAIGMRAMAPFLDSTQALPATQATLLTALDVLITGALLAGGADGLHKIVVVFTTYFDQTTKRVKAA